jgi:hypothetical protein
MMKFCRSRYNPFSEWSCWRFALSADEIILVLNSVLRIEFVVLERLDLRPDGFLSQLPLSLPQLLRYPNA